MKKTISFYLVLLFFVNFVYAEQYYQFNIDYNKGALSYSEFEIKEDPTVTFDEGGYLAEVVDANGKMLNLTFFSISRELYYDSFGNETIIGGGMIELDETSILLQVPYYQNAKSINVYAYENNKLNKKLTIDVSKYAQKKLSPEIKKASFSETETESIFKTKKLDYTMIFFGLGLLVLLGIFVLIRYRRK